MNGLGPDSSIKELFAEIAVEDGANVVPISVSESDKESKFMICICGAKEEASLIFAHLMTYVDQMYDASKNAVTENDDSPIILP